MAENDRFAVFVDWKRNLLFRRQLARPDQCALYQYRLAAAEFNELEGLLREWLAKLSRFELSQISRLTEFSDLFMLYAAEWWRLESPVVILSGLDTIDVTRSEELLYVGMSRAKSLLVLVARSETCSLIRTRWNEAK